MKCVRYERERLGIEADRNLSEEETEGDGDDGSQTVFPRQLESVVRESVLVRFAAMIMIVRVGVAHDKQKRMAM
jgi:hypothetical protein